ncbi:MAG: hypothetical protein IT458_03410, partial [Planctomycetes bacterium]|nr:hypothetical protein [Planctomycetota bacterium]
GCTSQTPLCDALGAPSLGNAGFGIQLSQAQASVPAVLAIGDSRMAWGSLPLPHGLGSYGLPGCSLLMNPLLSVPTYTSATGTAIVPFPIPPDPGLKGGITTCQWLVGDPRLGLGSFRLSEGALLVPH